MIEDGIPLVEVSEEVWRVWREYEARGENVDREAMEPKDVETR